MSNLARHWLGLASIHLAEAERHDREFARTGAPLAGARAERHHALAAGCADVAAAVAFGRWRWA